MFDKDIEQKRIAKQLLIGLPSTGKTTFLAALWHVIESEEVPTSLRLTELHGDREYLNSIRMKWLGCRDLDRTRPIDQQIVSMKLYSSVSKTIAEVYFPDLSGESFKDQWEKRQWTKSYRQLVEEAVGALLFIHPSGVQEPFRIDEAASLATELEGTGKPQEVTEEELQEWDPSLAPTQVQLVELLQFLSSHTFDRNPFRIAVIVSAWDIALSENKTPEHWVRDRLPLLWQFLKANSIQFKYRIYGVSAQGGDLEIDSKTLLQKNQASTRIIVIGPDCQLHDLVAPISWLME